MCYTSDNNPKRLSCAHTICMVCAQTMIDATAHKKGGPIVKCPLCNVLTPVQSGSATSLPTNLLWKKVQDVYKEYPTDAADFMKCYICRHDINMSDIRYCQNCHRDICVKCAATHIQQRTFKNHIIESQMKIYCKEHGDVCEYLCMTCDKFQCVACVQTGPCKEHQENIQPLDSLKEKMVVRIQELQKKLKDVKCDPNTFEGRRDEVKKKLMFTREVKQAIIQHGRRLCEQINDNVSKMIDLVNQWEAPLTEIEGRLKEGAMEELDKSIAEGLKGTVEEMVMIASLTESSLLDYESLEIDIIFTPEDTISVGQVKIMKTIQNVTYENDKPTVYRAIAKRSLAGIAHAFSPIAAVEEQFPPKQSVVPTAPHLQPPVGLKRRPYKKWHKEKLQYGTDVVFTPKGNIVVCDFDAGNVLMYNSDGEVITSSKRRGVEFEDRPWGLAHDSHDSAIIVIHRKDYLTFLSDQDLSFKRRVSLENCNRACATGVLSDGRLIVADGWGSYSIGIYSRQGSRQKSITQYGYDPQHEVSGPWGITVLPDDIIVVTMNNNDNIVYLTQELDCLQVVNVKCPAGLTVTPQGDVLVISSRSTDKLHYLKGTVGSIQSDIIMSFSGYSSVAMKDNQVAVLCGNALDLYEYRHIPVSV